MNVPEFKYPEADATHVYVPCRKGDAEREEYYSCDGLWRPISSWHEHGDKCSEPPTTTGLCGQHWRKRVAVPEGWEILPSGAYLEKDDLALFAVGNEWGFRTHQGLLHIRRKPAQPVAGQWVQISVDERTPDQSDADENGLVLALGRNFRSWVAVEWSIIDTSYSHWMRQPEKPAPPPMPKSYAELAWEKHIGGSAWTKPEKALFLSGYAAATSQ